jgi:hypothetical protein
MARRNFPPIETRFLERIVKEPDGCWLWQGKKNAYGYSRIKVNGKEVFGHRWSYEHFKEPIPENLVIDHLCRVKSCVNPKHLEAVLHRTNTLRGIGIPAQKARQTHCIKGHPFDEQNTFYRSNGWRGCRICRYERDKRFNHRRPAEAQKF